MIAGAIVTMETRDALLATFATLLLFYGYVTVREIMQDTNADGDGEDVGEMATRHGHRVCVVGESDGTSGIGREMPSAWVAKRLRVLESDAATLVVDGVRRAKVVVVALQAPRALLFTDPKMEARYVLVADSPEARSISPGDVVVVYSASVVWYPKGVKWRRGLIRVRYWPVDDAVVVGDPEAWYVQDGNQASAGGSADGPAAATAADSSESDKGT